MKHKTLAILCAAVLSAGMLTGCGTKEAAEETKTQETAEKSDGEAATVSDEEAEKAGFSDGEEASSLKCAAQPIRYTHLIGGLYRAGLL